MKATPLMSGVSMLSGMVNVYLLKTSDGYALIDTGFPGSADKILKALAAESIRPHEVKHIVLTHAHPDHIGSAAALKRATGATVYAHAEDALIIHAGKGFRKMKAAPGLRNKIMFKVLSAFQRDMEGTVVDKLVDDGESLPFDKDLVAIHVPGHSKGQLAFMLNRDGGLLFVADACINRGGMQLTAAIEDEDETRRSLAKLANMKFEAACFGHGKPLLSGADASFKKVWHTAEAKK